MHFSIPDTEELKDEHGSSYIAYNLHINGAFHCTVRYKQLHNLHEQLKKQFGSSALPPFPPKKLLPLTTTQMEERRTLLEKYIQLVSQDTRVATCDTFNGFLLSAQQETQNAVQKEVDFDVFLMNWQKVMVRILSTDPTDVVIDTVARAIDLPLDLVCYFSLYLVKKVETEVTIKRILQNFESPYLSQQTAGSSHCIVIRKSYWDSSFDDDLLEDRIALNLLYVQAVGDVERGWVLANKETQRQLAALQAKGSKKEYIQLARTLKYYGYLQFQPCVCDYPYPDTRVLISAGGRELNFRLNVSSDQVKEISFRVTRIRCWRITTALNDRSSGEGAKNFSETHRLELSFEYLIGKDKLQWVTVVSEQAILMSICLQGMVGELLMKKNGTKFSRPNDRARRGSWSFLKRDGSSYQISVSRSASSDGILNDAKDDMKCNKTRDHGKKDKVSTSVKASRSGMLPPKALVENDAFEGIGDDDL